MTIKITTKKFPVEFHSRMKTQKAHTAPLTLGLIVRVNEALSARRMTRDQLRVLLNEFLPPHRQIKDNHSGTVKLNRWMNPTGKGHWPEPLSEVSLALQLALSKILSENS